MSKKGQKSDLNLLAGHVLLEHVYKQLHKPLVFYAYKFIKDENIAKDLVQDAFLSILKKEGNDTIDNLKTFLYRCVRNNCINYINHKVVELEFQENEAARIRREIEYYSTHYTIMEKEIYKKLMDAIEELPEHYRTPFKLSRFENLKAKEIADKLGLPVRTVETKIYRALTILRSKLGKQMFSLFAIIFPKLNLV